jgi:hypothetical protein
MTYLPFFAAMSAFAALRRSFKTSSLRLRLRAISFCLSRMLWFSFQKIADQSPRREPGQVRTL